MVLVRLFDPSVWNTFFFPFHYENSHPFAFVSVNGRRRSDRSTAIVKMLYEHFDTHRYFVKDPTFDVYLTVYTE